MACPATGIVSVVGAQVEVWTSRLITCSPIIDPTPLLPAQSPSQPPSPAPPHIRHVIFIGETGSGKSAIINLVAGREAAAVSFDARPGTTTCSSYDVVVGGRAYRLWDTPGFNEPTGFGEPSLTRASERHGLLKQFLRERHRVGELDLIVFCVRAGRVNAGMARTYKTFVRASRQAGIPVVIAITHLEREEPTMDAWWQRNEWMLANIGLFFDGHACLTCLPGHRRSWTSREEILVLITADYRSRAGRASSDEQE